MEKLEIERAREELSKWREEKAKEKQESAVARELLEKQKQETQLLRSGQSLHHQQISRVHVGRFLCVFVGRLAIPAVRYLFRPFHWGWTPSCGVLPVYS